MGEQRRHSLVLAAEYPVADVDAMLTQLQNRKSDFADIDAHHVVVYTSMWGPRRALVTVGLHRPDSVSDILRSPVIFELFDIAGCDEIPALFAGEIVEKLDWTAAPRRGGVAGVIVGVVALVDDVDELIGKVHDASERFRRAGVCKLWIYKALDDSREVMILQEVSDEITARRWMTRPDAAAEWMSSMAGVYPKVFVGQLAHHMAVQARVS